MGETTKIEWTDATWNGFPLRDAKAAFEQEAGE